jgi:hypothetical protein
MVKLRAKPFWQAADLVDCNGETGTVARGAKDRHGDQFTGF